MTDVNALDTCTYGRNSIGQSMTGDTDLDSCPAIWSAQHSRTAIWSAQHRAKYDG